MANLNNKTINTASLSNKERASSLITWDEAVFTWDSAGGSWDNPFSFKNESVTNASLTNQSRDI